MITSHSTVEKYCGSGMDTAEESPLDVLSRAATMVQENQQASLAARQRCSIGSRILPINNNKVDGDGPSEREGLRN
ncbi:hypothetical protein GWI33_019507 [Rhynchophorus ferrugineus]|uniref:Uncharacterized protein n=1 Tax=Rhynchophorus ferrugineus TaxID=354439 RepID=A0A834HW04_RHYFE|nr:hypothetical protein GWI33_019507 [Rhynchophorus ferrugineus]